MASYLLIDSGQNNPGRDGGFGRKLEQFGPILIDRPSAHTLWERQLDESRWAEADAIFMRSNENTWVKKRKVPDSWVMQVDHLKFKISPTDFGHLGIFPEQRPFWQWIETTIRDQKEVKKRTPKVLNLFAYSGGSTLAAAKAGAQVCHLDASKGMVAWARENAALNGLEGAPIRWIVDDVGKFISREMRRGNRYDAIILDPPSFGRGAQGEVFKIEEDILRILPACRQLLSDRPLFVLFSCHTPGFTPIVMRHLLAQAMKDCPGKIDEGEMMLTGEKGVLPLPSGTFARWYTENGR
jgi:23S rRNA (cytosine1962-C5)-methyltransferase